MSVAAARLAAILQRARHQLVVCRDQPAAADLVPEIDQALAQADTEPELTALWHRLANQEATIRQLQDRLRQADGTR